MENLESHGNLKLKLKPWKVFENNIHCTKITVLQKFLSLERKFGKTRNRSAGQFLQTSSQIMESHRILKTQKGTNPKVIS